MCLQPENADDQTLFRSLGWFVRINVGIFSFLLPGSSFLTVSEQHAPEKVSFYFLLCTWTKTFNYFYMFDDSLGD